MINETIMSTLEIKQELHKFIDSGDDKLITLLYEKANAYREQLRKDKMIAEGEADIKAGRVHSLEEVKDFIDRWEV